MSEVNKTRLRSPKLQILTVESKEAPVLLVISDYEPIVERFSTITVEVSRGQLAKWRDRIAAILGES